MHAPSVDIIEDSLRIGLGISCRKNVVLDPCYKVIFKRALDELVQDVGREKLVYVRTGKVICEWLRTLVNKMAVQ